MYGGKSCSGVSRLNGDYSHFEYKPVTEHRNVRRIQGVQEPLLIILNSKMHPYSLLSF